MSRFLGPSLILLCTVIWGSAFLAQKLGADHYGPFAITCYRNVLGGLFLWLCIRIRDRRGRRGAPTLPTDQPCDCTIAQSNNRTLLLGGSLSGVCLFVAMVSQQLGIEHTTPGISAFLTANYVLLVPVFAWVIGRGRPGASVWLGVALALFGTCLICFADFGAQLSAFKLGRGEAWTLLCAALFAVQIMVVDRFAHDVDVVRFSMVQLFVSALCALPFVFLPSELARSSWSHFAQGLPALFYVGVLSSGIAYTLQNLGQAKTPPALAAIILSMESVFGALFGWLILHDAMTPRQLCGCALVFLAVVATQLLPPSLRRCVPQQECSP